MITHLVRDVIIDPASLEQTFISDFSNDAILQLRRTDKNTLQGQWYSRLYGHVGEFSAILNNKPEDGNTADYVPALGGSYYQQGIVLGQIQWSATFWSGSDEGDVISADPSRQLRTIGSLIASVAESSTPISMNTSITAVSYDYFTNSVFFRSGSAMFYGQVYWDHLVLRPVVTQYMKDGIAPGQKIVMLRQ